MSCADILISLVEAVFSIGPFSVQFLSFSCSFWDKLVNIVGLRPSLGLVFPLCNPGFTTVQVSLFCILQLEEFKLTKCLEIRTTWHNRTVWVKSLKQYGIRWLKDLFKNSKIGSIRQSVNANWTSNTSKFEIFRSSRRWRIGVWKPCNYENLNLHLFGTDNPVGNTTTKMILTDQVVSTCINNNTDIIFTDKHKQWSCSPHARVNS